MNSVAVKNDFPFYHVLWFILIKKGYIHGKALKDLYLVMAKCSIINNFILGDQYKN